MEKNVGKVFEDNIKKSCPEWLFVYRPPDAAQSFNMTSALRFSQRSPADYFWFNGKKGNLLIVECKTFQGACSFERIKEDKGIIHYYQIESLNKFDKYENVLSGFLLDFRKSDCTYFLSVKDLITLIESIDKKSFNEQDMLKLCSPILVEKKKLRTNYRYNIEKLLDDINKENSPYIQELTGNRERKIEQ